MSKQYCIVPVDGCFQIFNQVTRQIHTVYNDEDVANSVCDGLNHATRYAVLSNVNLFIVWDTHNSRCHSSGYATKHTADSICAILNGEITQLEKELLANVRSMSAKLYEVAETIERFNGDVSICKAELIRDCNTYAEYSNYLEQFPVMEQFGYK